MRKRLAALGVGLVFALVAAEITLRVSGVATLHLNPLSGFHNSDERLGWVGAPSYTGRFRQPEFDVRIEHDEEGFRRPAEAFRGAADAPQVVFLGDSFTWGWGVASGATFVDRVQAAVGDATQVRNRGVNGYGTTQHLVLLRERVLELRPRAVTLMFCENDVTDLWTSRRAGVRGQSWTAGRSCCAICPSSSAWSVGGPSYVASPRRCLC